MTSQLALWGDRVARRLGDRALPASSHNAQRVAGTLAREQERRRVQRLDDVAWVQWAYREALHREADPIGAQDWVAELARGRARAEVLQALADSPEAHAGQTPRLATQAFHGSRMTWTRSLPRARRILDLGGTSVGSDLGSLLVMGYPYDFDDLVIIDLPSDERHALYKNEQTSRFVCDQGPVRYLFRSMVDLDDLPDGGFDLVVSGQTFEHITEKEGVTLLGHVARLLAPGGSLALDTPNRALTAIQCAEQGMEFINPDHKVEYTHEQMTALFAEAGLAVLRAQGIGYMPQTARTGRWQLHEQVEYPGLYDAIEQSYTLAYLAAPEG